MIPARIRQTLRPLKRRYLAWRLRAIPWLNRRGIPWRVSPQAEEFDRYQRARAKMCPGDLSALRVPAEADLVSIVLPVYNGQEYVREAMDSVLVQRGPKFELIAVDDGSTDATPEILSAYARRDARVRVISQTNQKLPGALNAGFGAARGEFLTWISADNRFKPGFLDKMTACLKRHPAWDMIYANEDIIDEKGVPCDQPEWFPLYHRPLGSHHIHFPTDVSELNTAGVNYVGGAFMYRARVPFLIGGYCPSRFGLEDYDYWMRVNELLTLRHADFDAPVYDYRLHGASLTSRAAELEIEPARQRLLEWDGQRRRFCLTPLVWKIDAGPEDEECARLAAELRDLHAARSSQAVETLEQAPPIQVRIASSPAPPPASLSDPSPPAARVLVLAGDDPLPDDAPKGWDLCMAWSSVAYPQRLSRSRRGWLVTHDLATLAASIDIWARAHVLASEPGKLDCLAPDARSTSGGRLFATR